MWRKLRLFLAFVCALVAILSELAGLRVIQLTDPDKFATFGLLGVLVTTQIVSLILWTPGFGFIPDLEPTRAVRRIVWGLAVLFILVALVAYDIEKNGPRFDKDRAVGEFLLQFLAAVSWIHAAVFYFGPNLISRSILKFLRAPILYTKAGRRFFQRLVVRKYLAPHAKPRRKKR